MRLSGRFLLPLLVVLLCPMTARAFDGGAWTVQPGEWYSEVRGSRTYASSFFLPDGRNAPLNDGRFQEVELRSINELGWKKGASLFLSIPFTSQTLRQGRDTRTVSGLSDLAVGLRFRLHEDAPGLVLDAGWRAPLGYDKHVFPRLGDGRQKVYAALNGGIKLPVFPAFVQASKGVVFISEDGFLLSQTSADLAGWLGSSLLVGARYFDSRVWNSELEIAEQNSFYLAGPVVTLRVDDRLDFTVGAWRNWAGRNTREVTEFYVALGMKQTKLNPYQGFLGTRPRP